MKVWIVSSTHYCDEEVNSHIQPQVFTNERLADEYIHRMGLIGSQLDKHELESDPKPTDIRSVWIGEYNINKQRLMIQPRHERVTEKNGTFCAEDTNILHFWSSEGSEAICKKLEIFLKNREMEASIQHIIGKV